MIAHQRLEFQLQTDVPFTAFPTLSTACSSTHFAGLFHPTTTSEILTSGVFPTTQPTLPLDKTFPHVVTAHHLAQTEVHAASSERSAFRALLRVAVRCMTVGGLDLPQLDPLLCFHPPRALRTPRPRLHEASTHGLGHPGLTVPQTTDLQRINRCATRSPVPRPPARSRFPT
jgi:hypothetical protein